MAFDDAFRARFMAGQADEAEILEALADGLRTGMVWCARGYYRRLAQTLIDGGWVTARGDIIRRRS
ncbi:MAG: hypothetical protein CV088_13415 [Nitrospira sp. LK70]|nr:hypothetical protein [Nitrospira sp.]NGZ10366.1 hypothetical protein [Nitrospira sp. LK70]